MKKNKHTEFPISPEIPCRNIFVLFSFLKNKKVISHRKNAGTRKLKEELITGHIARGEGISVLGLGRIAMRTTRKRMDSDNSNAFSRKNK